MQLSVKNLIIDVKSSENSLFKIFKIYRMHAQYVIAIMMKIAGVCIEFSRIVVLLSNRFKISTWLCSRIRLITVS